MVELKLKVPEQFYKEEIRCGYTVSSDMKKVWAVQMDLLCELDRVCKKYGLTYYADSGTLIGAVRHAGYIPWDDDIDIVMMRKDYKRLMEVAQEEFSYPIFLQNFYSEKDYIRAHAQLRNSETTGCTLKDINTTYNKGIFIDIFPLDNVPNDEKELMRFKKRIARRWSIITCPYVKQENWVKKVIAKILGRIINYNVEFPKYEELCQKYNEDDTERISYIAYSHGKDKHIWKRSWFDAIYEAPYEFIQIPIPSGYDERLRKEYGDYMTIKQVPTSHGGVILSADIAYKDYLKTQNI